MNEPCDLGAVELRRRIGAKELSPRELLPSCLQRIEKTNPHLNAIIHLCEERARHEAEAAERAVLDGEPLGLLHGLPLGVKNLNHVGGLPRTFGSPLFANDIPEDDEGVVARMRAEGAIVVGKTNVPEHGFGATTVNPLFGTTNNPFNPTLSAGASSGGTAVALASGMVPLAMGSDFAGSLRTPASFCGIAGFRPSPGVVAHTRRPFAFSPFDVEGPTGRSAADCRLLLGAMAHHDPRDPLSRSADPALRRAPGPVDLSNLRVAFSEDLGFAPISRSCGTPSARRSRRSPLPSRAARRLPPTWMTRTGRSMCFGVSGSPRTSSRCTRKTRRPSARPSPMNSTAPQASASTTLAGRRSGAPRFPPGPRPSSNPTISW